MNSFGQLGLPQQQAFQYMERPLFPPLNLQPGFIPQVNINVSVPPQLAQISGDILFAAIMAIQAEATQNKVRLLFFNALAENGYSNARFAEFMSKLLDLVDIMLTVIPTSMPNSKRPQELIQEAAIRMTQFKMAQLAQQSQVMAYLDSDTNAKIGYILNSFQTWVAPIENAYNGLMQQRQFAGGAAGGAMGQQRPMYGNQSALPQGTGFGSSRFTEPVNNRPTTAQGYSQSANYGGANPALGNFTGATPPPSAPPPAAPGNWRDTAGHKPLTIMTSNPVTTLISATSTPPPAPLPANVTLIEIGTNQADQIKSQIDHLQSLPRAQAPEVKLVYDLNMFTPQFLLNSEGKQVLQLVEKSDMDRELHLGRPNHTPAWVKVPTVEEADARLEEARQSEPEGPIIDLVEVNRDQIVPATNRDDTWSKVELGILTTRKTTGKVVAACAATLIVKPMSMSESIVQFLDQLIACETLAEAGALLKTALEQASGDDHLALTEFNRRLTDRVNRAVSKEMMMSTCTITDFSEDAADQQRFIGEDYGNDVMQAFIEHGKRVLKDALQCLKPGSELYRSISGALFGEMLDENNPTYLPLLGEFLTLASVDLNSAELRLELGTTTTSAMLLKDNAPLMFELVEQLRSSAVYDPERRLLLRTTDGVIFQIDHGVHNTDAMLISVVS